MKLMLSNQQKQIISQKMILSAKILQMTAVQLDEYLGEKSLENPVLELAERPREEFDKKELEKYQWISAHDEQNRYLYQKMETEDQGIAAWDIEDEKQETLKDYLWSQLLGNDYTKKQERILDFMLESLDSKGYFLDPLESVASRFQVDTEEAEQLLKQIQKLEPAGVGARSLEECLILQLRAAGRLTDELECFVRKHLKTMAKNQLPVIAREMKLPLETIKEFCSLVRQLEPKPGARFSDVRHLSYIVPDLIVVKFKDHFGLMLNESLYPDIVLNMEYVRMCSTQEDPEVKKYLMDKIHQAQWLKKCVAQRNSTLFSVAQEILIRQEEFFKNGQNYLKPLRMADVAEALDIHESTVSRAVSQKYIQCTWGIFPMSHFFARAAVETGSEGAADESVQATVLDVKRTLAAMIQKEDHKKPYSDRILAELLEKEGFPISRRTVAKYREEMGIPGATGRKEY